MKKVIKRDGKWELFNIEKIQKYTRTACEGLADVSQSELELDASRAFYDGIKTEEIQKILIHTAIEKTTVKNPNWDRVAARLYLNDLYHKVKKNNKLLTFDRYLQLGIQSGKILNNFTYKFDIQKLSKQIDNTRDLNFSYIGIKTLYDRYLLKTNEGELLETPQFMFMCIAMFLSQNEEELDRRATDFYHVLSRFEFMLATPTLSNARTPRHQLSSCFVGSTHDSIEGIFDSYKTMALLSKNGGGIGWDFSRLRALGSSINGTTGTAGGIIPFLKIANDVAVAVDQLGTRKGAIAVYIEIWHPEVIDFIDLRKNSGDERRRAHDLFPALWICDLFMKRLKNNENWTLLDPLVCSDLTDVFGAEFESRYIQYEKQYTGTQHAISINTKELWKHIITNCYETGLPFVCFKDNANHANPNKHCGIIRSSNLCTEIFQNTTPSHYKNKIEYDDGTIEFESDFNIKLDNNEYKRVEKVTNLDIINKKKCNVNTKKAAPKTDEIAVCNLGSINISKVNTPHDIKRVVKTAVRMLDNVIDLNMYPVSSARNTNHKMRAIGLGIMGEAQLLATNGIVWGSENHEAVINRLLEQISFHAIETSTRLAHERGVYPQYQGSDWSQGILPIDRVHGIKTTLDWSALRYRISKVGMRNGYLMAIAPTSNISIITNTTQSIEPIYKTLWYEDNLSGITPVVAPNLNENTKNFYTSAYNINMNELIKIASVRQRWIDQGQSLNLFIPSHNKDGKYISNLYIQAWELGLKSIYYLRSQSPTTCDINNTGCQSCQ